MKKHLKVDELNFMEKWLRSSLRNSGFDLKVGDETTILTCCMSEAIQMAYLGSRPEDLGWMDPDGTRHVLQTETHLPFRLKITAEMEAKGMKIKGEE
jgi:hypothetical protein